LREQAAVIAEQLLDQFTTGQRTSSPMCATEPLAQA
jgi:hypothetical protein